MLLWSPCRVAYQWVAVCLIALLVLFGQSLADKIYFSGDALTAAAYVLALACATIAGWSLVRPESEPSFDRPLTALLLSILAAAIASIGIALLQWTDAASLGIWQAELPPGQRPFGNVAQPNHLCTIAFLGICAAGILRNSQLIGRCGFWVAVAWMAFGMVMSGSRTGWVQMACLLLFVFWAGHRCGLKIGRVGVTALALTFAAAVLLWPDINTWLLLDRGRPLADTMSGGTRIAHWLAMLDAIGREPCGATVGNRSALRNCASPTATPSSASKSSMHTTWCWTC